MVDNDTKNPRPDQPDTDPRLGPVIVPSSTLAESLGGTVDDLRQIAVDLGLRPYRVFSVTVKWSGGEVGRGDPAVVNETEFLPTPELVSTEGVRGELRSGGLVERGNAQLRRISPRYVEDQIHTMFGCAVNGVVPSDSETFIEIRVDARDGSTERRRFTVVGVPFRKADAFEWRASLLRQDSNRTRSGKVVDVSG